MKITWDRWKAIRVFNRGRADGVLNSKSVVRTPKRLYPAHVSYKKSNEYTYIINYLFSYLKFLIFSLKQCKYKYLKNNLYHYKYIMFYVKKKLCEIYHLNLLLNVNIWNVPYEFKRSSRKLAVIIWILMYIFNTFTCLTIVFYSVSYPNLHNIINIGDVYISVNSPIRIKTKTYVTTMWLQPILHPL